MLLSKLEMIVADDRVLCPNKCGHKYKGNGKWPKYNLKNHLMYLWMQSTYRQFQCNIICCQHLCLL